MKIIVGLGNPEPKYEFTRHNIGFLAIDYLQNKYNQEYKKQDNYLYFEQNINNEKILFIKPQTYMNNSGEAVKKVVSFYKVKQEDILVIYDDIDLLFSTIRIKYDSSSGGHNGIKSIINHLGTQEFYKLKIGILNDYKKQTKDFVLSKFSKEELKELPFTYSTIESIVEDYINNYSLEKLCQKYN